MMEAKRSCQEIRDEQPLDVSGGMAMEFVIDKCPEQITTKGRIYVIEDRIIAQALRLSRGNKKEAARLLHVNRTTLLEKLKRKRAQGSPRVASSTRSYGRKNSIGMSATTASQNHSGSSCERRTSPATSPRPCRTRNCRA